MRDAFDACPRCPTRGNTRCWRAATSPFATPCLDTDPAKHVAGSGGPRSCGGARATRNRSCMSPGGNARSGQKARCYSAMHRSRQDEPRSSSLSPAAPRNGNAHDHKPPGASEKRSRQEAAPLCVPAARKSAAARISRAGPIRPSPAGTKSKLPRKCSRRVFDRRLATLGRSTADLRQAMLPTARQSALAGSPQSR